MRTLSTVVFGLSFLALAGCAHKQHAKSDRDLFGEMDDGKGQKDPCAVRVHFDYDSSEIPESDRPALAGSARCLKEDRTLDAMVEGNADERGTEEYNLALGDKRASSVAKYLSSLGAYESQLRTISYGEENPVCKDHHETCWFQNRRAAVRPRAATPAMKKD
jgi:peptidoglycan-associated lipoprotein